MSPQQQRDVTAKARAFIEQIEKINRKHGMGGTLPAETHERAVQESADVAIVLIARS